MPIIKLIVTGEMEKLALHDSLKKLFPAETKQGKVEWKTPHCLPGATSARLKNSPKIWPPMERLANTLLAEVKRDKNGMQPDLVLLVDDLELHNIDQQQLVAQHLRNAINNALITNQHFKQNEAQLRRLLRDRCSFHLLKPLPEAYFFGDKDVLQKISIPAHRPQLKAGQDLELFEVSDISYLEKCKKANLDRQDKYPHWREECHPKHYLSFLNPHYEETKQGAHALRELKWQNLSSNQFHLQSIRALFADLANWFNVPNPLPGIPCSDFFQNKTSNLLRNM